METVVNGNYHHITMFAKSCAIIAFQFKGGSVRKTAAVQPDHHGLFGIFVHCFSPDIKILTALILRPKSLGHQELTLRYGTAIGRVSICWSDGPIAGSVFYSIPFLNGFCGMETLRPSVGNPLKVKNAIQFESLYFPICHGRDWVIKGADKISCHFFTSHNYYNY